MMDKFIIRSIAAFSAAAAPLVAGAAATDGNCMPAAVKLTPSDDAQKVTLVREWDPEGGDAGTGGWMDGGDEDLASYVKWYYVELTKGNDYVAWVEGDDISMDIQNIDYSRTVDGKSILEPAPESQFAQYGNRWYIRSSSGYDEGQWSPEDPDTCRFYILFNQDGDSNKTNFYFRQASIANYAPAGSALNPKWLDVSKDGGPVAVEVNDGESEVYYTLNALAGYHYVFTCESSPTNMPNVTLDSIGDASVEVEEDTIVNSDGGVCTYDLSVAADVQAVIKIEADNPSLCTLSWRRTDVGTVGFAARTVQVRDDAGYAEITVSRTSSDVAMRYEWMTVAETAEPGVDYAPMAGELVFEAGGGTTETITIPIVPGLAAADGSKSFAVRLKEIDSASLGDDEYSPVPDPNVARVVIVPTGESESAPDVPTADDEDEDAKLSTGAFEGVIATEQKDVFAEVRLVSDASGALAATVSIDGSDYEFTGTLAGTNSELVCGMTVGGETFKAYLYFTPPAGKVADLADGPADAASVSGSLYVDSQGAAEEVFFSGGLYRVETRLDTPTLERMAVKAGRYVTALGADWQPGVTDVAGILTVDVGADGAAAGYGTLADGTEVSFESSANDVEDGIAVPVAWSSGDAVVAGTLQFGAEYDYWTSLERMYNGWALVASDETSPFDGLVLTVSGGKFVAENWQVPLIFEFDRESGVMSGSAGDYAFRAVLLASAGTSEIGAAGYYTDGKGNVAPFTLQNVWLDPDRSENWGFDVSVSFDPDGGSGTMGSISVPIGEKFALPECSFTRTDHRFAGWRHPFTDAVLQSGAETYAPAADSSFRAVWENVKIKEALDCDDLAFSCVGESNWDAVELASAKGGKCVQSVFSDDANGSFTISADVESAGVVSFKWGLVRRQYWTGGTRPDTFELLVDGGTVLALSGEDFASPIEAKYEIETDGAHSIVWRYVRASGGSYYTLKTSPVGRAMLDDVAWEPVDASRVLVTFDAGEYGVSSATNVYSHAGEAIGELPTAAREGCTFAGWTTAKGAAVTASTIVPAGGFALFADWRATVSFDGNGDVTGNVPDPVEVEADVPFTLPDAELGISEDFEFLGWRLGDRVYAPSDESDPIASNVTFVAEWKDNTPSVTIAFDANGGTCDAESIEAKAGTAVDTLPEATLAGAAFVGWYLYGERVTLPYTVGRTNVVLTAHWGVTVSFDAGGADGTVPADIAAEPGDNVVLPGCGDLALANHSFAGWTDGTKKYAEGESYAVNASATLTAVWKNTFYNGPLDCDALDFSSPGDSLWEVASDGGANGGTCLSVKIKKGVVAQLAFTAPKDGTLSFSWALTRFVDWSGGTRDDKWQMLVDGVVVATLATDAGLTVNPEIELTSGQTVEWRFTAHKVEYNPRAAASAKLDNVVWTPAVPVDFSDAVVTDSTTPGDLGITNGAFSAEAAGSDGLKKLVAWAKENGITVAEVNGMEFSESGEATDELTEAYLLDCAVADIQDAKELFRINSFSAGADGAFSIDPADGDAFGNGTVELRYSDTPKGPFSSERPAESGKLFIRLYLVR